MMAGKWLVETPAAEGGACGRIGGSANGAGNGGGPEPLGKVDASIIDCILESQSETGDGGRKIVRVEGAPEASGSVRLSQCLPFHEGIVVASGCWRFTDNVCW
jgi:hypothetical protein